MNPSIGGDHRPLAAGPPEPEAAALAIDGERLKREREQRCMSIPDAARLATLSREQITQIEQGGIGAFYGPRHKLLAVRKYAHAFGIDPAELLPPDTASDTAAFSADLLPVIGGGVPDVPQEDRLSQDVQMSAAASSRLMTGLAVICALAVLYSIVRGLVPASLPPDASPPLPAESPVAAPAQITHDPSPVQAAIQPPDACSRQEDDEPAESWAPPLARRADTRLFLSSAENAEVCVIDATGAQKLFRLKPGVTSSLAGKPPYLLRSAQLGRMQIYLQGMRVRVPSSAVALKLFAAERAPVQPPMETASPES